MPRTMETALRTFNPSPGNAAWADRVPPVPLAEPVVSSAPLALNHALPASAGGHSRRLVAKELIFSKGDTATHLFYILDGRVKVSALSESGKEIIFALFGPGELFGETALIEGTEHNASAMTLEPTEVLAFDRLDFLALLRRQPSFALSLLTTVCVRLRRASELAEDISFLPFPIRLAKRLLALAGSYGIPSGTGIRIGLHVCQQELANMVGTSRESVNKQLAIWHKDGLISTRKGYLTIVHPGTFAARHRL